MSVDAFKGRLERHKLETIASGASSLGHFLELSGMILSKINNREHESYAEFMSSNPAIAKYRGVNVT